MCGVRIGELPIAQMSPCFSKTYYNEIRYQTTSNGQLDSLKAPRSFEAISGEGIALRDLVFHEKHAACVDASGNVYQWGEDFFGSTSSAGPEPTLKGKVSICVFVRKNFI